MAEMLASRLASELGIELCIVRPGAFVDYRRFDLRVCSASANRNVFRRDRLASSSARGCRCGFSARTLIWLLTSGEAPAVVHLFDPARPTKASWLNAFARPILI
jgi:hypothetical protein